jgi:hypothetical protein
MLCQIIERQDKIILMEIMLEGVVPQCATKLWGDSRWLIYDSQIVAIATLSCSLHFYSSFSSFWLTY